MLKTCNPFTFETFQAEVLAKQLLNKRVIITTVKGAKYAGKLTGFNRIKMALKDMTGLQKDGDYKFVSGTRGANKRTFNISSLAYIVEAQ